MVWHSEVRPAMDACSVSRSSRHAAWQIHRWCAWFGGTLFGHGVSSSLSRVVLGMVGQRCNLVWNARIACDSFFHVSRIPSLLRHRAYGAQKGARVSHLTPCRSCPQTRAPPPTRTPGRTPECFTHSYCTAKPRARPHRQDYRRPLSSEQPWQPSTTRVLPLSG